MVTLRLDSVSSAPVIILTMEQALLLNASYEPLKVVNWQKAITLWCQGKVEVIADHDREIRAVSVSFKLPSVIRLLRFVKIRRRFDYVPFSRANIYARDNHTCQYCREAFSTPELTFDHVVPVAHGGRKDWENIVTCCVSCNRKKGGRTPAEAGMRLLRHRAGRTRRPRSASRSACTTRPKAGATIYTGTSSSTTRSRAPFTRPGRLPTISDVSPDKAVEGARVVVHGSGFSADAPPVVRLGGHPALVAFVSPTRMVVLVPSDVEGEDLPLEIENDGAGYAHRSGRALGHRPPSGGQPRVRPRRPPLRHLQRSARTGGAGFGVSRRDPRRARALRVRHRQRHVAGVRSRRSSLRLEPLRRRRLSRGRTTAPTRRWRPTWASPAVWRSTTTAGCTSAIARAPSSACATAR